ncbi:hypothetical protein APUTEX25_000701, partial [Auxenochlorella protothecoides]
PYGSRSTINPDGPQQSPQNVRFQHTPSIVRGCMQGAWAGHHGPRKAGLVWASEPIAVFVHERPAGEGGLDEVGFTRPGDLQHGGRHPGC